MAARVHLWPDLRSVTFFARFGGLALLFLAELLLFSVWLDGDTIRLHSVGLPVLIGLTGGWLLRAVVVFAAVFTALAYVKSETVILPLFRQSAPEPVSLRHLAGHFVALSAFALLSFLLLQRTSSPVHADLVASAWLIAAAASVLLAAIAFVSPAVWRQLFQTGRAIAVYALLAAIAAPALGALATTWMQPATRVTFAAVEMALRPFTGGVVASPATLVLGTGRFQVAIYPECAGFEGAGLMIVFGAIWLVAFHRECRFPHALLLLPAGILIVWLLNVVRLAALIRIGDAGFPNIALGGFHSQAGWIAFTATALLCIVGMRRLPWMTVTPAPAAKTTPSIWTDPTAAHLLPFLAILAAGIVAQAISAHFEWLYPLRFAAAAAVLWCCRRVYRRLDWRFGWQAPAAGVLVFIIWVVLDRFTGKPGAVALPDELAAAPAATRVGWIAVRFLAAAITVPVAEELAFRSFLLRRLISPAFESARPDRIPYAAWLASSVAFGCLHGPMTLAGILAGAIYGWLYLRRFRIGEAVVAHGVTNALLGTLLLFSGNWRFW